MDSVVNVGKSPAEGLESNDLTPSKETEGEGIASNQSDSVESENVASTSQSSVSGSRFKGDSVNEELHCKQETSHDNGGDSTEEGSSGPEDIKNVTINSEYSNVSYDEVLQEADVVMLSKDAITPLEISQAEAGEHSKVRVTKAKGVEAMSKSEKELQVLCKSMFSKLEIFLQGEVANSVEDYALLERMNSATSIKYEGMLKVAKSVVEGMHEVNGKFSELRPYLEQIEQIEQEVTVLEQAAYKLDGYAKRLEERFRKLEKR